VKATSHAGGHETRLRKETAVRQNPTVDVAGVPVLGHSGETAIHSLRDGPLRFSARRFKFLRPPSDAAGNQFRRARRCRPEGSLRMPSTALTELPMPHRSSRRWIASALGLAALTTTLAFGGSTTASASAPGPDDWLGIINVYRGQSGLAPVSENSAWSGGARNHSCWMLLNGIAHGETPGTPGYTVEGDQAGNSGNVAVSTNASATARSHIDLWMTGPFHAIGLLRSSLQQSGFGLCASPPNPSSTNWKSAATLDVVRGNNWGAPKPPAPVMFPGNGSTTSLTRFIAETPDPRTFCGWGGQTVGLPLIALMPSDVTTATATLNGPNGPVPTCVLHRANTSGAASAILGGDNGVVVVPATQLTTGTYTVAVASNGGNANWSFNVDPTAPLVLPPAGPPAPLGGTTALTSAMAFQPVNPFRFADSRSNIALGRLPARQQVRLKVAGLAGLPADMTAVSANFTAVGAPQDGYLTASNCAEADPAFSTLNYEANDGVPNQAIVSLSGGDLCLFSSQPTDIVIDINGYVSPSASQVFVPVNPARLLDSRSGQPLRPGSVLRVSVAGGGSPAPADAVAVAVNLTGILPDETGWIRAFPCDMPEPGVSSLNPRVGRARANSAIVPTAADGTICLTSNVTSHVIVDITGWFGARGGQQFVPINAIRVADTRQAHPILNGGAGPVPLAPGRELRIQIAGTRGIEAGVRAATLNLVAVGPSAPGFLVVVPCGQPSNVSNLNFTSGAGAVANGTNVKLDPSGAVCLTTSASTHVIVDLIGVWK
jgi:uncharacterized protein YkwD